MRFAATLRWVIASSANSYGYTLTIWATGAVALHHRGIPTETDALTFVVGAIAAFALVGMVANRGLRRVSPPQPAWLQPLAGAAPPERRRRDRRRRDHHPAGALVDCLAREWLHRDWRVPGRARRATQRGRLRTRLVTELNSAPRRTPAGERLAPATASQRLPLMQTPVQTNAAARNRTGHHVQVG